MFFLDFHGLACSDAFPIIKNTDWRHWNKAGRPIEYSSLTKEHIGDIWYCFVHEAHQGRTPSFLVQVGLSWSCQAGCRTMPTTIGILSRRCDWLHASFLSHSLNFLDGVRHFCLCQNYWASQHAGSASKKIWPQKSDPPFFFPRFAYIRRSIMINLHTYLHIYMYVCK